MKSRITVAGQMFPELVAVSWDAAIINPTILVQMGDHLIAAETRPVEVDMPPYLRPHHP
jgi:hypothetical protein